MERLIDKMCVVSAIIIIDDIFRWYCVERSTQTTSDGEWGTRR